MVGCGWDRSGACNRLGGLILLVLRRALAMIGNR